MVEVVSYLHKSGMQYMATTGLDMKIKERVFEVSPLVKGIYKDPTNPYFEIFYLEEVSAAIAEIGKPPVIYTPH